jgi:hypothetical protein
MLASLARLSVLGVALILCAASAQEPTYSVRRSALVPHAAPPQWTGQPVGGRAAVHGSNTTVLVPAKPVEALDANAGLHIARTNFQGGLRIGRGDLDAGPLFEVAPEAGAMEINDDFPGSPHGPAVGYGLSTHYSAKVDDSFRLGFGADLLLYRIPYFEQGTCVANCEFGANSYQEHGTHTVGVVGLSVVPSYKSGGWTLFGSLSGRNHPSNLKGEVQTASQNGSDDDDEVSSGPYYLIAAAGTAVELGRGVEMFVQVFQPLTRDPVIYGPSVGAGLTAAFGEPIRR